jgi:hypothetical protein
MSLSLAFADGRVCGSGRDMVGRFDFAGTYELESGRVKMVKQYEQAHRVAYDGANQNDGLWLWGVWKVGMDRGGFHLWPEGEDDPTQRRSAAERELPKASRLRKGELVEAAGLAEGGARVSRGVKRQTGNRFPIVAAASSRRYTSGKMPLPLWSWNAAESSARAATASCWAPAKLTSNATNLPCRRHSPAVEDFGLQCFA